MTRKASIHFGPDSQTLRDEVHGIRTLSKSQTTKTLCRTSARQTFGLLLLIILEFFIGFV